MKHAIQSYVGMVGAHHINH